MKVIRRINSGGFGTVDEIELDDGRRLARKTFAPSLALLAATDEEKLRARFRREALVQSQFDPHYFVPIIGTGLDADPPFYLMLLADRNLESEIQSLRRTGEIPDQALADILNSLEKLHDLGYVHRDLKPQNVLLEGNVWKLGDFGLVLPPSTNTTKLTSVHSAWGTEAYCAPEQSLQFGSVTHAADIYAFGCILHDVFVGSPRIPYQRHSGPGPIGTIIEKCTEFRPQDRFKTVASLRGALLPLLASGSPTTTSILPLSGWAKALETVDGWNGQTFRDFVMHLASTSEKARLTDILLLVSDDSIRRMFSLDAGLWARFASEYTDWVMHVGFEFSVCDVVVRRLETIFELGDPEAKAKAVLAAAEMARSHNRWFVMGRVVKLCGPTLDDTLAQRIAIEIAAGDAAQNFRECAQSINEDMSAYHPRIAQVLE